MNWKTYLNTATSELSKYLKSDIQYSDIPKDGIRQIAWRETEIFIKGFKKWAPEQLILNENRKASQKDQRIMNAFLKKRKDGIPLAYILGKQDFYGLEFKVNKYTLIPRPETEELVGYVLDFLSCKDAKSCVSAEKAKIILIDIGTGSGCILTALLKNLHGKINFTEIYAVDENKDALDIAKRNTEKHMGKSYKIKFVKGSLLKFLSHKNALQCVSTEYVIIANLPYLSEEEYQSLSPEVKKHEPKSALVGGKEGYELICELINQIVFYRRTYPCRKYNIFLEISPTIYPVILKHCKNAKTPLKIRTVRDISKKIRFLHISIPPLILQK